MRSINITVANRPVTYQGFERATYKVEDYNGVAGRDLAMNLSSPIATRGKIYQWAITPPLVLVHLPMRRWD